MNDQVKYSLAGFCMGVAELIPGISGSTVAVIFKIYPNLMSILSQLRLKNFSLNFFFDFSDISVSCLATAHTFNVCSNPFMLEFNYILNK